MLLEWATSLKTQSRWQTNASSNIVVWPFWCYSQEFAIEDKKYFLVSNYCSASFWKPFVQNNHPWITWFCFNLIHWLISNKKTSMSFLLVWLSAFWIVLLGLMALVLNNGLWLLRNNWVWPFCNQHKARKVVVVGCVSFNFLEGCTSDTKFFFDLFCHSACKPVFAVHFNFNLFNPSSQFDNCSCMF